MRTGAAGGERRAARGEVSYRKLRAPFSLRCGALLVDYTLVVAILAFATILARFFDGSSDWRSATALTFGYIAALAVAVLNFVVLAAFAGRTIGKWVTGLRIERVDGAPLSVARAALRHLVGYPITLLTLGVGFLIAVFSVEGRALHDLIAGTVVVRERAGIMRRTPPERSRRTGGGPR